MQGGENQGDTPTTPPPPPPPPDPAKTEQGGGGSAPSTDESTRAPDLADGWIFETGDKKQVQKASLPAPLAARRSALARCLADARSGVAAPQLRLRVERGKVTEVAFEGGSLPACARDLVGLALPGVDDGWLLVRVKR